MAVSHRTVGQNATGSDIWCNSNLGAQPTNESRAPVLIPAVASLSRTARLERSLSDGAVVELPMSHALRSNYCMHRPALDVSEVTRFEAPKLRGAGMRRTRKQWERGDSRRGEPDARGSGVTTCTAGFQCRVLQQNRPEADARLKGCRPAATPALEDPTKSPPPDADRSPLQRRSYAARLSVSRRAPARAPRRPIRAFR